MFVKNPMKATASSINPVFGGPEKTINGIIKSEWSDMFHSGNENYPWLAIDLGFFYKVILPTEICAFTVSFVRSQGCQWWNVVVLVLKEQQTSISELV